MSLARSGCGLSRPLAGSWLEHPATAPPPLHHGPSQHTCSLPSPILPPLPSLTHPSSINIISVRSNLFSLSPTSFSFSPLHPSPPFFFFCSSPFRSSATHSVLLSAVLPLLSTGQVSLPIPSFPPSKGQAGCFTSSLLLILSDVNHLRPNPPLLPLRFVTMPVLSFSS